ncbi:hypothetical protein STREPTOSP366_54250 [Streptomyces variabilis]
MRGLSRTRRSALGRAAATAAVSFLSLRVRPVVVRG